MATTAFDTLKTAESLAAAGIAEPHAKAIAGAMREALTSGDLVTRADLRVEVARLEARIAETKVTLLLAVFGAAGLLFALLKLFP